LDDNKNFEDMDNKNVSEKKEKKVRGRMMGIVIEAGT